MAMDVTQVILSLQVGMLAAIVYMLRILVLMDAKLSRIAGGRFDR